MRTAWSPALPCAWYGGFTWRDVTCRASSTWPVGWSGVIENCEIYAGSERFIVRRVAGTLGRLHLLRVGKTEHMPILDWLRWPSHVPRVLWKYSCPRGGYTAWLCKDPLPANSRLEAEPWHRPRSCACCR